MQLACHGNAVLIIISRNSSSSSSDVRTGKFPGPADLCDLMGWMDTLFVLLQ
jgi:hypothetical protein